MIEEDTIKLLRECDAGTKMGIKSIEDVWDHVKNEKLKEALQNTRREHIDLEKEIHTALNRFSDQGKDPNPMAETMSWLKSNVKLAMDGADSTVADLMTEGCNMGIKSLRRYMNQYTAADEDSKRIANTLISSEKRLVEAVAAYL